MWVLRVKLRSPGKHFYPLSHLTGPALYLLTEGSGCARGFSHLLRDRQHTLEVEQTGVDAVREGTVTLVTRLTEETDTGQELHFFLPQEITSSYIWKSDSQEVGTAGLARRD